jgi:hypothetical protein
MTAPRRFAARKSRLESRRDIQQCINTVGVLWCNYMKFRFAAVLVIAACVLVPRHAGAMTTSELLQSCHAVTASGAVRAGATLDIPAAGLPCWYYMSAMQNMAVLVDESGTRFLGVCPPADSTVMDFVRIFVQHARKQQATAENAAASVLPGLAQAFPCR